MIHYVRRRLVTVHHHVFRQNYQTARGHTEAALEHRAVDYLFWHNILSNNIIFSAPASLKAQSSQRNRRDSFFPDRCRETTRIGQDRMPYVEAVSSMYGNKE
jgi:hypothetical protein